MRDCELCDASLEDIARLKATLLKIHGLLGSALLQALSTDDQIIIGHVRDADALACAAIQ